MKCRVYIIVFTLTFLVALSPLYIGNTGAYNTISVDTIEISVSSGGQSTQQTVVEGQTTASSRSTTEEQIIIEEQPPKAAPNTQRVGDGFFWIILAFAMLLFAVFVYMSYRRKMLRPDAENPAAALEDEDEGI